MTRTKRCAPSYYVNTCTHYALADTARTDRTHLEYQAQHPGMRQAEDLCAGLGGQLGEPADQLDPVHHYGQQRAQGERGSSDAGYAPYRVMTSGLSAG